MSEPYWVPMGAAPAVEYGKELAYAEFTANVSVTATTEPTSQTLVTAPATVFDGSPILIQFSAPYVTPGATSGQGIYAVLYEDGVLVGNLALVRVPAAALMHVPVYGLRRHTPSAGAHTYSVRSYLASAGTGTWGAGSGYVPGFIRITKV